MIFTETAEEIIKNISDRLEELRRKGCKVTKIPIWDFFAHHIVYENRFGGSEIKNDVYNYLDLILKRNSMLYHIPKDTIIYRARKIKRNEIKKNAS